VRTGRRRRRRRRRRRLRRRRLRRRRLRRRPSRRSTPRSFNNKGTLVEARRGRPSGRGRESSGNLCVVARGQ
jgi:hypothetical protein